MSARPDPRRRSDYLVVRCLRCDDALTIWLASRTHPIYCDECAALLAEAVPAAECVTEPRAREQFWADLGRPAGA